MLALSRRLFGLLTFAGLGACAHGQPAGEAPTSIDEGLFVDINGLEQWITIRGRDRRNPVLLLLHGGPGFPTSSMAPFFARWEEHFTLVQWDQPGGGATYARNPGGQGELSIARYVADGVAVSEWTRRYLKTRKITLLGNSWGTVLGVMLIQRRPELFAAYVGASQAVSGPEGGRVGYQLGLDAARARGDAAAVAALERVGPPPYGRFEDFLVRQTYTNPPGLPPSPAEAEAMAAFGRVLATPAPADARYIARGLPEQNFMQVFFETQRVMFSQSAAWDARALGLDFAVPVFVYQGENDLNTPVSLARAWVDEIRAPAKGFEVIPGAGHNTLAFADQILALIDRDVRPLVARTAAQ